MHACVYIFSFQIQMHDVCSSIFNKAGFQDVENHSNTRSQYLTFSFTCSSHSVPHLLYTHPNVRKTQFILTFHSLQRDCYFDCNKAKITNRDQTSVLPLVVFLSTTYGVIFVLIKQDKLSPILINTQQCPLLDMMLYYCMFITSRIILIRIQ